jgi:hypothetical protein
MEQSRYTKSNCVPRYSMTNQWTICDLPIPMLFFISLCFIT